MQGKGNGSRRLFSLLCTKRGWWQSRGRATLSRENGDNIDVYYSSAATPTRHTFAEDWCRCWCNVSTRAFRLSTLRYKQINIGSLARSKRNEETHAREIRSQHFVSVWIFGDESVRGSSLNEGNEERIEETVIFMMAGFNDGWFSISRKLFLISSEAI